MTGSYFRGCETLEEVKKAYRELAKRLHPDAGGNAEEFKAMSAEYERAFERLKNVHRNKDGETYEKATSETPQQYADIINRVILFDGVKIEIIGSWIWLSGNTKPYKEILKEMGFSWSKSKTAWYYTGEGASPRRRGYYSMNELREKWGATEVQKEESRKIS